MEPTTTIKQMSGGKGTTTITTSTIHHHHHVLLPLLSVLFLTAFNPTHFVAADVTPTAPTTIAAVVNGSGVTTEGGGGAGGGGTVENATKYENFSDVTKFVAGINEWDFMGSWAKYDLAALSEDQRPLPLVPDGDDQGVFICQTSAMPSTLQKEFPPLHNATFALTYYAKADDGELQMTGEVVGADGEAVTLFNQSAAGEGESHAAGTWGTDTFELPLLAAMGNFQLRVGVRHSEAGMWATAEMRVEGLSGPPLPPSTTIVNGTTAEPTDTNITTTTTTTTTTTEEGEEEDLSNLEGIAQAIWDAFYVFLALFCACLVALVALIVHGRCKDDEPPPAVATYNPRTASYRMDKVYDNPSYDNNSV